MSPPLRCSALVGCGSGRAERKFGNLSGALRRPHRRPRAIALARSSLMREMNGMRSRIPCYLPRREINSLFPSKNSLFPLVGKLTATD